MLEVLLSSTKKKEKMQQLEGYGLKMTTELEGCVSDMCNISEAILERALEEGLEKGIEQGLEKGIEQGIEQGKLSTNLAVAKNLLALGMPVSQIMQVTGLTKEQISSLQAKK